MPLWNRVSALALAVGAFLCARASEIPQPRENWKMELIAGSTRMKAGTAQKVVLNLISSGIMLRLGRVYCGMMVNMQPTNAKLRRRAEAMVAQIANCDQTRAACVLEKADGDIKTAVLLALGFCLPQLTGPQSG